MKFVIFHGAFGSPDDNWFPQLREKLEDLHQEVIAIQFPKEDWDKITKSGPHKSPKNQTLKNWLETFEKLVLPHIRKGDKLCFVGHSLGSVFILHVVDKFKLKLDNAIFTSPFLSQLENNNWQFDHVNHTFYETDFDFRRLKKLIPTSYVFYSDDDPYVDTFHPLDFAKKLGSKIVTVKNGGHLTDKKYACLIFEQIKI